MYVIGVATTVELTPTPVIICFCKWQNFSTTLIGTEINDLLVTISEFVDSDINLHCNCVSPWLLDPTLQEDVESSSSSSRRRDDLSFLQLHSVNMACSSFLKEADDLGLDLRSFRSRGEPSSFHFKQSSVL